MADIGSAYGGDRNVGFVEAIQLFFRNYVNFQGRSSRGAYWWWVLANILVQIVLVLVIRSSGALNMLYGLWCLAIILPSIALSVRRLHDIGRSGWWIFIYLVPLVGFILWLIWACTPGQRATNQFGPDVEAGR